MKNNSGVHIKSSTTPIKSPVPDVKRSNRITSTTNVKHQDYSRPLFVDNQSYEYREHRTPTKIFGTPKNQTSTSHKYFTNNRSSLNYSNSPQETSQKLYHHIGRSDLTHSHHSYCHEAGHQINSELKKLLSLIGSSGLVSEFRHYDRQSSPDKQKIQYQISCIQKQNKKLIGLIQDLQERSLTAVPCQHAQKIVELQHQISILRSQLSKSTQRCDKQYQSLYRQNQQMSSKFQTIEDRNRFLQKQADSLRLLLKQKQDQFFRLEQDNKKKNSQQKLSLSMIKDQYNESIKVLKNNFVSEIQLNSEANEKKVRDLSKKISSLEKRIYDAEVKLQGSSQKQDIAYYKSQLQRLERALNEKDREINKLREERKSFQSEILFLNNKIKDSSSDRDRQIEIKIRSLMQNYEKEMNLLKGDYQTLKDKKEKAEREVNELKSELSYLKRVSEEEIENLRSQIYTLRLESNMKSDVEYLQKQNNRLIKEINYLKDRIHQLQQSQRTLNSEIRLVRTSSISTIDFTNLKNKNSELSHELSQKLIQITNLHSQNRQLSIEHQELQQRLQEIGQAYQRLQKIINSQQNDNEAIIQEKNKKIYELENTIHSITQMLEEMQQKLRILDENKARFAEEYQASQRLRNRVRQLQNQLRNLQISHQSQINRLRIQIYNQAQQRVRQDLESDLTMKILQQRSEYNQSIKNQLLDLKALVDQGKFDKLQKQLVRISDLYNKELINAQKDRQQIDRLLRVQVENDNKKNELQKLNIALEQKSRILDSNNKIMEKQLKERKQMYEQLLSQKSILEKQLAVLKRSSIDSDVVKNSRLRALQISRKIDRLLQMQEQIGKSVLSYSSSYIVKSSTIKKKP